MRSSLKPLRSISADSAESKPDHFGSRAVSAPEPLLKLPPESDSAVGVAAGGRRTTCTTPTNDVAPYITGAAPRWTSMRSTSPKSSVARAGLNAPPQGTPSTTSRKASNSFRPQNSGTLEAGPPSPPTATSTPAARASALARSPAPRSCSSAAPITSMAAGTFALSSGIRVAVTWTTSL